MPTLAIFVHSLSGGGAERAVVNLARSFSARGISVDLVLLHAEGAYLSHVPADIRIVDLGGGRLLFSLSTLIKYLKQERPAILLSSLSEAEPRVRIAFPSLGADDRDSALARRENAVSAQRHSAVQDGKRFQIHDPLALLSRRLLCIRERSCEPSLSRSYRVIAAR